MSEVRKYLLRFGLIVVISTPTLLLAGKEAVKIALYKLSMVAIGVGFAELIWVAFFKPHFGKMEDLNADGQKSLAILRSMLYAAIVLGLTLGL